MNLHRVGRWLKSGPSYSWSSIATFRRRISWWGSFRKSSRRPSSPISSRVEGWTVSPRKSRKKSACFSSTVTSTPARARRKPSITPAGPPPATQQVVRIDRGLMLPLLLAVQHPHLMLVVAGAGHGGGGDGLRDAGEVLGRQVD